MKTRTLFVFLVGASSLTATAQNAPRPKVAAPAAASSPSAAIPVDPKVHIGTLPNGLRYYIRQNKKPENRAELRLVVNAGSVLETDQQLGMAHFIEHMAFNGTTHFKRNELISYLQSIGVKFGADLNAETSFDETVYILPIPTDTARIVSSAIQILADWARGQLFDSTEVANERGVVLEEWRTGRGASERMLQQWLPIALKGSLYAKRLPIGNKESIESANPATLRAFYDRWYRPDLMAVIAVGDFEPAAIESLIKSTFGPLHGPAKEVPRPITPVLDNREPLIAVATDKEATSSSVDLMFKLPHEKVRTVGDYRRDLEARLYLNMLNARLDEIGQKPDAPFLGASASKEEFIGREKESFSLGAEVKDGGIERGLDALLLEAKRVDEFGFLQSELDRAKQNMLRSYERAYAERAKTNSGAYVGEYINNYLEGEPTPGIEYEYDLVKRLVPTISLTEVNKLASRWITDENHVILAEGPDKPDAKVPTTSALAAVFQRTAAEHVTAYSENLSSSALLPPIQSVGGVVSERSMPDVGVTEWKLSNGARVLFKTTDFKDDEVLFTAYAPGGTSIAPDSDVMSAEMASQIVSQSGLGAFSLIDLQKKLSGKVASASPSIGETTEGVSGRASPQDLETLFQLINLDFTGPRLDTAAFVAFKNRMEPALVNKGADPDEVFSDTIQVTMSQHDPRARPLTTATFAEVNPEKAFAFYRARFADASPFTFMFVGNVTAAQLKPLVEKYLATLPAAGHTDSWRDAGKGPPAGVVERTVRKGVEPKANTLFEFTGPFVYNPENRFAIRALLELFQMRLDQILREQLGGTYSPSVGGAGSRTPRQQYTLEIEYGSSPQNVDTLSRTVFKMIDSLKTFGPTADEVAKVKEQLRRSREVQVKQNAYWLGNIAARDQAGEPLAGLLTPYDDMVKGLTAAQIQDAAKKYFDTGHYAKFVLLPEK